MSRDDLLAKNAGHRPGRRRAGGAALARRDPDHRHQPARRDVPRRADGVRASRASACSAWPACSISARFRTFIAQELGVSVEDTHAFVLGGHGDTMVPLSRYSTVAGVPITELLPADRVEALEERTANGGAEVVALLKTGSAFYAPAAGASRWSSRSCSTASASCPAPSCSRASSGPTGLFVGVPVVLGAGGMERVFEIELTADEQAAFDASAAAVRELVDKLG